MAKIFAAGYEISATLDLAQHAYLVYDEDGDYVASIDGSPESFYKAMINAV